MPFEEVENRFAAIAQEYYSVRFMWSPVTDIVFTKLQVPIPGPLVRAKARSSTRSLDIVLVKIVAFANERQPRRWRRVRQLLSRWTTWQFKLGRSSLLKDHNKGGLFTWYDGELESRLHAAFVKHPFVNLEYAIPLNRCDQAVNELRLLFKEYPVQAMSFMGLRPVGADDAGYLAPPKGRDVVYFDIPYVADLESTGVYAAIERKCLELGGRCSWSRLIYASPHEFLRNYPEHSKFVEAKRELDPSNVFSNEFSDRICFNGENEHGRASTSQIEGSGSG
jgi:FAD/FMN-containing dehydrogenase